MRRYLDRLLFRGPFVGPGAYRYLRVHRPAFGDLDARLVDGLARELAGARVVLDLGSGDGRFAARIAERHPDALVIAVEPSAELAALQPGVTVLRGLGERLPLPDGSVDVAILLSSLRHVVDRGRALRELRRVVRPGGTAVVVELDPEAGDTQIRTHVAGLGSSIARVTFTPLLLRTAPTASELAALARHAGWRVGWHPDAVQPFYWMRLG